ncbi:MAG: hypothetical protein ABI333_19095 [bacterium]
MRKLMIVILPAVLMAFSMTSVGCGSKWVSKAEKIKKAACACSDKKCAKDQQKEILDFAKESKGVKVKKSDAKKVAELISEAQKCILKIYLKGGKAK